MTISNLQISQIAERAAEHVEHGWCQRQSVKYREPVEDVAEIEAVCLGHAVGLASLQVLGIRRMSDVNDSWAVWGAFVDKIRDRTDGALTTIPPWNDAKGRTQQEVIDLALEVAKDYRILADQEGAA